MKKYIYSFIILIMIGLSPITMLSQEMQNPSGNPIIDFFNKEKIRIKAEQAVDRYLHPEKYQLTTNAKTGLTNLQFSQGEIVVSEKQVPESEVFAAINPKNEANIVVSPIKQDMTNATEAVTCPVYYSFDSGETWNLSTFKSIPKTPNISTMGGGDPVLVFDEEGNLYFSWINLYLTFIEDKPDSLNAAIFWAKSTDGGKTFEFENENHFDNIYASAYSNNPEINTMLDKQWMAADRSHSEWRNSIYTSCLYLNNVGFLPELQLRIYHKRADENSFNNTPAVINTQGLFLVQFGNVEVDSKGYVHYTFYGYNLASEALYHTVSKDGGVTFSKPTKISDIMGAMRTLPTTEQVIGLSEGRMYPSPHLAIDNGSGEYNGNLYITWTGNGTNEKLNYGLDIYFSQSSDEGKTWSKPITINKDKLANIHSFYSNIAVNSNGVIAISYYDRANHTQSDPKLGLTDYVLSISYDGGETFVQQNISSKPSEFFSIGKRNNEFGIGEYNSLVMTKEYAYPVWADGRSNDGNVNIYMAKIKLDEEKTSVIEISTINQTLYIKQAAPNPANDYINIEFFSERRAIGAYELIDINGKVLISESNMQFDEGINSIRTKLTDFSSGTYFIKISTPSQYTLKRIQVIH